MAERDGSNNYNVRKEPLPPEATELSVMDWLLGIGHVVVRRLRGVPRAPMIRLHPRR